MKDKQILIRLTEDLHYEIKKEAVLARMTMNQFVIKGIRDLLEKKKEETAL